MRLWALSVLLASATSIAAQTDDPFWNKPDQVTKDDSGRIVYQEVRDRAHYTLRIFSNGAWTTQHYRPHTTQLLEIDEGDATERWLYDEQGKFNGLSVSLKGVTLTAQADGPRLGASGMGSVTLERDENARITAIRDGATHELARFQFDPKGYLRTIATDAVSLALTAPAADGTVTETLTTAAGKVLAGVTVPGSIPNPHVSAFCLEPIVSQLGLGDDWQSRLTFRRVSGSVYAGITSDGKPVVYILRSGETNWVFDAAGKPLLIDLQIPLVASSYRRADTSAAIHEQSAVAPNHLLVTADGRVGACTIGAASGAIASFWTERGPRGAVVQRYKIVGQRQQQTRSRVAPLSNRGVT
jgi:hypothetical protein